MSDLRASLRVQVSLKSNQIVDFMPIGEAAQRLGLRPSALRYYDERGLVSPSQRLAGRRMYGPDELRRLAFIKVAQRLGLPLSTSAAVLDAPGPRWRQTVRQQIVELDDLIAQAQAAQRFLTHALDCPTEHGARVPDDDRGAGPARRWGDGRATRRRAPARRSARRRTRGLGDRSVPLGATQA